MLVSRVIHASEGRLLKPYSTANFDTSPGDSFRFFFDEVGLKNLLNLFRDSNYSAYRNELLEICNGYVAGQIQFLGRPPFRIEVSDFFWQSDPTSGFIWPYKYFTKYPYDEILSLDKDADVKFPWELARLQMLPQLAVAFLITHDRPYLITLTEITKDWLKNNPVGHGLGWRSTMESSLRAISLIWLRKLLPTQLSEFGLDQLIDESLLSHGRFIERNTEYSDINGNHHSSCLIGLLYVGLYFGPKHKLASSWIDLAQRGLEQEVLLESYPDGLCIEGSLPYHRLITEFFLHGHRLLVLNNRQPTEAYTHRLDAMLTAVAHYTKPNGNAPVVGDHDDAQTLKLGTTNLNDHRYLSECLELISKNELKVTGEKTHPLTLWLAGNTNICKEPVSNAPPSASHHFSDTGVGILRRNDSYILMDGGDTGLLGRGSHGHNDLLSIELVLASCDIFRDPGNGAYTRSTHSRAGDLLATRHNLPVIDGIEYAAFRSIGFPVAKNPPHFEISAFKHSGNGPQSMTASLSFDARNDRISQTRTVTLNPLGTEVTITDSFQKVGHLMGLPISWCFILDPTLVAQLTTSGVGISSQSEERFAITLNQSKLECRVCDGVIFSSYGLQEQTKELHIKGFIEDENPSFEIKIYALT